MNGQKHAKVSIACCNASAANSWKCQVSTSRASRRSACGGWTSDLSRASRVLVDEKFLRLAGPGMYARTSDGAAECPRLRSAPIFSTGPLSR
jgi:hypothetical protein